VLFSIVRIISCALGCTRINPSDSTLEDDTETTPAPTYIVPVTSQPDPLDRTRWKLVAFESEEKTPSIPEQPQFFVEFRNGEVSLQGGCNSIGGHYVLENEHITITFAKRTEMDCSYLGSNVNEIEMAFSTALPKFDSYSLEVDEKLRIHYMDGELLLRRARD
jgi:heat shock protein HslJ